MSVEAWFSDWSRLGNIALSALFFYVFIVALARVSGKRTTSQLNNFDWIMMIAVGSLAASGILLKSVAVLDSAVAILALFLLQGVTTWLVLRSEMVRHLVNAEPTLLVRHGELLQAAMRKTRVSEAEIMSALRDEGIAKVESADWVILENDGTFSIIAARDVSLTDATTMQDVARD